MTLDMKNPVERGNADGAISTETNKGNCIMSLTPMTKSAKHNTDEAQNRLTLLMAQAHSADIYPLTEIEARHAARLWFTSETKLSLADWRDNRCHAHCCGLPGQPARAEAFRLAFSRELAAIIAGGRNV